MQVRAAATKVTGGKPVGRRFKTDDVVTDVPLPQFKLDLAFLGRLLAERRPLARRQKLVNTVVTSVPIDTKLMITIQRASNLPVRMDPSFATGTTFVCHSNAT